MRKLLTILIFALCPFLLRAQGDFNNVAPIGGGMCAIAASEGDVLVYTEDGAFHKEIYVSDSSVNDVASFSGMIVCACSGGLMAAVAGDGRVMELRLPQGEDVLCLGRFGDMLMAGGGNGLLVTVNSDFSVLPVTTGAKGRFVGISSTDAECYAMTDRGELLRSKDGVSWSMYRFNEYYRGFYPEIRFTALQCSGKQILAAGVKPDGSPAVYISDSGGVWSERMLVYTAPDGRQSMLQSVPLSAGYDAYRDRFVIGCEGGELFTIPGCSHCNKLHLVADDDILGLYCHGPETFVVGRNELLTADAVID